MEAGCNSYWTGKTLAGFDALSRARPHDAVSHWLASISALEPKTPGDPRLAASYANLGTGYILVEQGSEAKAAFAAAERGWLETIQTLATLEFPVVGRSSSFHFRLATHNVAAFQETRRKRYGDMCHACLAITRFNRLFADDRAPERGAFEAAARKLAALLSRVFGPRAADVRALAAVLAYAAEDEVVCASPYAEKSAEFESRLQAMSALLPEACANLEAATALTALIVLDAGLHPLHRDPASVGSHLSKLPNVPDVFSRPSGSQ